MYLTKKHNIT